eukprot:TRINITY_DN5320_c2_g1_i1.p1 TRINITY_DN5320_c2_g1~~TRINITY_DN5320_c2_g1_i1.p1  ORF type:complete len:647 (+),score=97.93 TRINITY_DN5320_c2_g1_i1:89-2029(+)
MAAAEAPRGSGRVSPARPPWLAPEPDAQQRRGWWPAAAEWPPVAPAAAGAAAAAADSRQPQPRGRTSCPWWRADEATPWQPPGSGQAPPEWPPRRAGSSGPAPRSGSRGPALRSGSRGPQRGAADAAGSAAHGWVDPAAGAACVAAMGAAAAAAYDAGALPLCLDQIAALAALRGYVRSLGSRGAAPASNAPFLSRAGGVPRLMLVPMKPAASQSGRQRAPSGRELAVATLNLCRWPPLPATAETSEISDYICDLTWNPDPAGWLLRSVVQRLYTDVGEGPACEGGDDLDGFETLVSIARTAIAVNCDQSLVRSALEGSALLLQRSPEPGRVRWRGERPWFPVSDLLDASSALGASQAAEMLRRTGATPADLCEAGLLCSQDLDAVAVAPAPTSGQEGPSRLIYVSPPCHYPSKVVRHLRGYGDDPCPICLEPLAAGPVVNLRSSGGGCGHPFHADCIAGWWRNGHSDYPERMGGRHATCPSCREPIRQVFGPLECRYCNQSFPVRGESRWKLEDALNERACHYQGEHCVDWINDLANTDWEHYGCPLEHACHFVGRFFGPVPTAWRREYTSEGGSRYVPLPDQPEWDPYGWDTSDPDGWTRSGPWPWCDYDPSPHGSAVGSASDAGSAGGWSTEAEDRQIQSYYS